MTTFLWIRHATHDLLGVRLAGRMAGVSLNTRGSLEARRLGTWLVGAGIDSLYTSPLDRCVETAGSIGSTLGRIARVLDDLNEIDFGAWTGRPFDDLADDPAWTRFNTRRSEATIPGGESMREAQRRVVAAAERLSRKHAGETIGLVTHGDVIKAVVAHALESGLDRLHRFEIDPASVSTLVREPHGWRVIALNESPEPGHGRVRAGRIMTAMTARNGRPWNASMPASAGPS